MEVSVVGSSQTSVGKGESRLRKLGFCNSKQIFRKTNRIGFDRTRNLNRGSIRVALKPIRSEVCRSEAVPGERCTGKRSRPKSDNGIGLFVGLPLDCHNKLHIKAIAAGLKALKLLGVDGVDLPIWWGIVEKETPGQYEWSSYLGLAEMVRDAGMKLRVSICFHGSSKYPTTPLPQWVSQIGEAQPDIFFTDRSGRRYKECLSLGVDEHPVLNGKTPMQVFEDFCKSFKSSFSALMGSTINDILVSLGPDGELRYPSLLLDKGQKTTGAGEFQCYDKYMLDHLKHHATSMGQNNWGLSGPHDAPQYNESPESNGFMKEHGGSWDTPYGDFFLSWYSNQLIAHGERLLSLASLVFADSNVTVSGKVPLLYSWYKTRSHPSELTAGYYNTAQRDGYNAVAEMFARNSCKMVVPSMDLSDECQPEKSRRASPDSLISQIIAACETHGVEVSGENSSDSSIPNRYDKIKERIFSSSAKNVSMDLFTYQRMGAQFFSPENFPLFTKFVRSLEHSELRSDDLPADNEEMKVPSLRKVSEQTNDAQMQAA